MEKYVGLTTLESEIPSQKLLDAEYTGVVLNEKEAKAVGIYDFLDAEIL